MPTDPTCITPGCEGRPGVVETLHGYNVRCTVHTGGCGAYGPCNKVSATEALAAWEAMRPVSAEEIADQVVLVVGESTMTEAEEGAAALIGERFPTVLCVERSELRSIVIYSIEDARHDAALPTPPTTTDTEEPDHHG